MRGAHGVTLLVLTSRYGEETVGVLSDCFSVAQAFTPGIVSGDGLRAPLTALEKALELSILRKPDKSGSKNRSTAINPGVNAWANGKRNRRWFPRRDALTVSHLTRRRLRVCLRGCQGHPEVCRERTALLARIRAPKLPKDGRPAFLPSADSASAGAPAFLRRARTSPPLRRRPNRQPRSRSPTIRTCSSRDARSRQLR